MYAVAAAATSRPKSLARSLGVSLSLSLSLSVYLQAVPFVRGFSFIFILFRERREACFRIDVNWARALAVI